MDILKHFVQNPEPQFLKLSGKLGRLPICRAAIHLISTRCCAFAEVAATRTLDPKWQTRYAEAVKSASQKHTRRPRIDLLSHRAGVGKSTLANHLALEDFSTVSSGNRGTQVSTRASCRVFIMTHHGQTPVPVFLPSQEFDLSRSMGTIWYMLMYGSKCCRGSRGRAGIKMRHSNASCQSTAWHASHMLYTLRAPSK